MGCVRLTWYWGKMYGRHRFSYGLEILNSAVGFPVLPKVLTTAPASSSQFSQLYWILHFGARKVGRFNIYSETMTSWHKQSLLLSFPRGVSQLYLTLPALSGKRDRLTNRRLVKGVKFLVKPLQGK